VSEPILFEVLPAETPAHGNATLPALRGMGRQTFDGAVGLARLPALTGYGRRPHVGAGTLPALRGVGVSVASNRGAGRLPALTGYGSTIITVPDITYGYAMIPPGGLHGSGVITLTNTASGDGTLPMLQGLGLSGANVGRGTLPALTGTGYARVFEPGAAVNIYQNPGYLWMPAGNPRTRITEHLALSGAPLAFAIHRLLERIALADTPRSFLEGLSLITESVEFVDRLAAVWKMLLAETVALEGVPTPSTLAMQRMVETLALVAGPGTSLEARNLVAEALALNDALAVTAKEQIGDTAAFGEALSTALRARMRLLDELLIDAVPAATARVLGVLEDSVALDGSPTSALEALNRLQETIGFSISLRIGDDLYLAWVVNTETRSASTYTNFPFNSFCEFEGRYYGAAEDGIYHLDGEDDAGEDIQARIRLGMSNLGISREKRIPALYLAYRADGRMVLKAVVTEIDGSRTEWWYGLTPRGAGDVREGRIQMGRGLKAVMWDFEIANLDGADFELADLKFLPMVLDRRVRGRDDG
jgi:hypothetical protein